MFRANATLTYSILPNATTEFDPVTGEPIFTSTDLVLKASLEEAKPPQMEPLSGVDESAIYLEGRCMEPKKLPIQIKPNSILTIAFHSGQETLQGKFYLLPTIKGRLGLDGYFGDPIAGYLIVNRG